MPRGFLVKRTRRPCGSYRIPCGVAGAPQPALPSPAPDSMVPFKSFLVPNAETGGEKDTAPPGDPLTPFPDAPLKLGGLEPLGPWSQLSYSPVQPVHTFFRRYLRSPATAESFPGAASLLCPHQSPLMAPESRSPPTPTRPARPPAKKPKAGRKLHFTDAVTTSPVLGLKITAEEPDGGARRPPERRPPLGAFICQLCKEHYADPFALAQHKCSRIVRVEYRCPECDKVFSCPANLASHRRWHKPRTPATEGHGGKRLEGKENSSGRSSALSLMEPSTHIQHQHSVDSSLRPGNSAGPGREEAHTPGSQAAPGEGEEEAFHCPYCHKRFRRHAYLRKHLLSHQPYGAPDRGQLSYPCALCGVHLPSTDTREKHTLWHAVREELLLPLEGGRQIFPCEFCPTAFFSSPGLSLHMNKCHPSESGPEPPCP